MVANSIIRSEIKIGERSAPLVARVNRRAKRLILRVDPVAGEILVTAPSIRSLREAIAFANERRAWIAEQLDDNLLGKPFCEGMTVPYRGDPHLIRKDGGPRAPVRVIAGATPTIRVGGATEHLNRRLTDWFKKQARASFIERTDYYCERLGAKRGAVRIRDTKSRWGSCSSRGDLSFSWRLILAPPEIFDYVAAHECVHLIHMDHSPAYWRLLASLNVDARAADTWFNQHGARLFSYGAAA